MPSKTIAAISTPLGQGGIAIIRISGPDSRKIASSVFFPKAKKNLLTMKGYTACFGSIFHNQEKLDEGVALIFAAPNSYTGEDVIEISCHGGTYIVQRVLNAILDSGADLATPGEFTKRAFLNSKLSLTQAEAVLDLIHSKNKAAAKVALAAKDGVLNKSITKIQDRLLTIASHLSAWADFPDEDIPEINQSLLKANLLEIHHSLNLLLQNFHQGKILKDGINIAIVGTPNSGKSTLMNRLSGYEKSIVTDIPGTTRDIIEENIMISDVMFNLYDTAGIRETLDVIENIGVEKSKQKINHADIILLILDGSKNLSEDDISLCQYLKNYNVIPVINKIDKLSQINTDKIKSSFNCIVYISAKTGQGIQTLKDNIISNVNINKIDLSSPMINNQRQKNSVKKAVSSLNEAISALENNLTLDAITVSIESSIDALFELEGKNVSDEVIQKVFSDFCVGK